MLVCTVAEERDCDAGLFAHLEGKRRSDNRRQTSADDGVRAEIALLDVIEMHRATKAPAASLGLAVELRHERVGARPLGEGVPVCAMGRRDHVVRLQRFADADSDGLLPDRDVEKAGEVACAEALLDFLLESPDEQHLVKEVKKPLAGEVPPLFDRGHARAR